MCPSTEAVVGEQTHLIDGRRNGLLPSSVHVGPLQQIPASPALSGTVVRSGVVKYSLACFFPPALPTATYLDQVLDTWKGLGLITTGLLGTASTVFRPKTIGLWCLCKHKPLYFTQTPPSVFWLVKSQRREMWELHKKIMLGQNWLK